MNVTFVSLGHEQLPVCLLGSLAEKEGHRVGLAYSPSLFNDRNNFHNSPLAPYFDDRPWVLEEIVRQQPQVLAFSGLTSIYDWMLGVARDAKELLPGVKVVFGGVHASAVPEAVMAQPQVDAVCVGEAEYAFPRLLKAIGSGGLREPLPNTLFRGPDGSLVRGPQEPLFQDLDSLPLFDKRMYEDWVDVGDLYLTMCSRGCAYRCTFCCHSFTANLGSGEKGKYVRYRSPEHVMAELLRAKRRYKLRMVFFRDEVFTISKPWLSKFLPRFRKEIGVPFQCLTHPSFIDDETAHMMKEGGCERLRMGIQTAAEDYKNDVLHRCEKPNQAAIALDALRKAGVRVRIDHMFGLPGEPQEAQELALDLYLKHPPDRILTYTTTLYPGTEMTQKAFADGLLTKEDMRLIELGRWKGNFMIEITDGAYTSEEIARLQGYRMLFRLMPILPRRFAANPPLRFFSWLARQGWLMVAFLSVVVSLIERDSDNLSYILQFRKAIWRFGLKKFHRSTGPATQFRDPLGDSPLEVTG